MACNILTKNEFLPARAKYADFFVEIFVIDSLTTVSEINDKNHNVIFSESEKNPKTFLFKKVRLLRE